MGIQLPVLFWRAMMAYRKFHREHEPNNIYSMLFALKYYINGIEANATGRSVRAREAQNEGCLKDLYQTNKHRF